MCHVHGMVILYPGWMEVVNKLFAMTIAEAARLIRRTCEADQN